MTIGINLDTEPNNPTLKISILTWRRIIVSSLILAWFLGGVIIFIAGISYIFISIWMGWAYLSQANNWVLLIADIVFVLPIFGVGSYRVGIMLFYVQSPFISMLAMVGTQLSLYNSRNKVIAQEKIVSVLFEHGGKRFNSFIHIETRSPRLGWEIMIPAGLMRKEQREAFIEYVDHILPKDPDEPYAWIEADYYDKLKIESGSARKKLKRRAKEILKNKTEEKKTPVSDSDGSNDQTTS